MSYSLTVRAGTKGAAKDAVASEFEKIVASQPIHSRDSAAVLANANAIIDLLADDDTKDINVSCNGYVSWTAGNDEDDALTAVSASCSANHATRA